MAVYTNDLRLKEIATGDESGTWGTSTNTNLSLIADAFGFGTEAITTNADVHTTTIADGSADPGRSIFLKYTGTLDSACTITIGPNTVSKLWFIENATSGSQNIIIKQGSGATVTIANGQTKAIYSDGAGSGGAMVDAFTDLSVPSFFVSGDLDVDGTTNLDVVDIDGALTQDGGAVFNEASADVDFRVESNGNEHAIFVNAGDDRVTFFNSTTVNAASGTADGASHYSDGRTDISKSGGQPLNLRRRTDGGIITGYFSESSGSVTNVANFSVTTGGDFSLNTPNGNFIINEDSNDSDFRVESNGNTHMLFVDAGNDRVLVGKSSTGLANQGVEFEGGQIKGTATGQTVQFLNRASSAGTILDLRLDNTTKGEIAVESTGLVINEASADLDFRVESNSNTHRIFLDGGNDRVLFGTNTALTTSTTGKLQLSGTDNAGSTFTIGRFSANSAAPGLSFVKSRNGTVGGNTVVADGDNIGAINFHASDGSDTVSMAAKIFAEVDGTPGSNDMPGRLTFFTTADGSDAPTERMRIDSVGHVLIGQDSGDAFNADSMLRLQRTGDRVFIQLKTDADQDSGILFGDVDDDVECSIIYEPDKKGIVLTANNGNRRLDLGISESVFNEDSEDVDFRIESNNASTAFKIDAGTNNIHLIDNQTLSQRSNYHLLQCGTYSNLMFGNSALSDHSLNITSDAYFAADGEWEYLTGNAVTNMFLSAGTFGVRQAAAGSAGGHITYSTPFFIDADGDTGIGITTPDCRLHVRDGDAGGVTAATGSVLCLESNGDAILQFLTPNANNQQIRFGDPQDTGAGFIDYDHNTSVMAFAVNGPTKMSISSSGQLFLFSQTSGAGNSTLKYTTGTGAVTFDTSSRLVKEDIEDIPYGLSAVMSLSPKKYRRTDSNNKDEVGFIADEMLEVVPEIVGMMKKSVFTGVEQDAEEVAGSVEYEKLTAVLVKAIQEQQAQIEALQTKVAALEGGS